MDSSTDINQDPLAANDTGAMSFDPAFDMTAINEAVAAGGEADNIQNTFDVNSIDLANTPTSDADLQRQLADNPNMSLANSSESTVPISTSTPELTPAPELTIESESTPIPEPTTAPESPAEPIVTNEPTITDLANNSTTFSTESTVAAAPAATPPSHMRVEDATSTTVASKEKHSKLPHYILASLIIIAVALSTIAIIVSAH